MQIILVSGRRLKAAKTLTIMPRHVVMALLAFVGLVLAVSLAFSWLSVQLRLPVVQELILSLQQRETQRTHEFVSNNLQLMATRLGELQARVLQLDTLGEHLSALVGAGKETAKESRGHPSGQGGPLIPAPMSAGELQREIERLAQLVDSKTDELTQLESRLVEKRAREHMLPTMLPVKEAVLGSNFGYRSDPIVGVRAMHEGLDFNAETGTPVLAAATGVVLAAEYRPDYGNVVDIDHGEGLVSRYAHLSRILIKPGHLVRRGERIGAVGSTGRSTGSHLHFEVRLLGVPQNPVRFLQRGAEYAQVKRR